MKKIKKNNKNIKKGLVIAISGDKTVKVEVKRSVRHKILKKLYIISRKFLVHDQENKAKMGDIISIMPGIKVSKNKSWHIVTDKLN